MNTGFVTRGVPDGRFLDFYKSRSSPKLHCAIVGNVAVPGGYGSNAATPIFTTEPVWSNLASAIRTGGSLPAVQLATAWDGYVGLRKVVTSGSLDFVSGARHLVDKLGSEGVAAFLDSFDLAAKIATHHGFGHVQIHAAHGYLLSLLVDSRINCVAMSVLDRLALLSERLMQQGIQTSIRISLKSGDLDFDSAGSTDFQDTIARLPFDFVDLSSGFYNSTSG